MLDRNTSHCVDGAIDVYDFTYLISLRLSEALPRSTVEMQSNVAQRDIGARPEAPAGDKRAPKRKVQVQSIASHLSQYFVMSCYIVLFLTNLMQLDRLLTSAAADAAAVAEVALVVDGLAPPGHRQKLRPPG